MYHSVIVLQTKRIPEFTATICDICINSGRPEHEPAQIAISARYSNPSAVTEEYCLVPFEETPAEYDQEMTSEV